MAGLRYQSHEAPRPYIITAVCFVALSSAFFITPPSALADSTATATATLPLLEPASSTEKLVFLPLATTSEPTGGFIATTSATSTSVPTVRTLPPLMNLYGPSAACGSIEAPVGWPLVSGPDPALEITPIDDCANPFGLSDQTATPYSLRVGGETYQTGATIATPDGMLPLPLQYTGSPSYDTVEISLFKHVGDGYQFVHQQPTWREEPFTQPEVQVLAEDYFATESAAQLYYDIHMAADKAPYFTASDGTIARDAETGERIEDRYEDFVQYLDERREVPPPPITAGTYTLVFNEYNPYFNQRPVWQKFAERVIPIAHAEGADPVRRFAITFTLVEAASACADGCASNVLFLPGIQASRLYTETEKVWEPGNNSDVRQLEMTTVGESVHPIYTKDVIDYIPPIGSSVYGDFLEFLSDLETQDIIAEWDTYAYDWRYDVFDIVRNGTQYETYVRELDEVVQALALTSHTKKVTLVAHSNGGLLAKALLVEHPELATKIDTIIFIGTPHMGAPKGLAAMLHGYGQQKLGGLVIDDVVARALIKHMPGTYSLLPSVEYLAAVSSPLVSFADTEATQQFNDAYGFAITNGDEYRDFLLGVEGRTEEVANISMPSRLNGSMYMNALISQHRLHNWTAPPSIDVYNIVGVGEQTPQRLLYRTVEEWDCVGSLGGASCTKERFLRPYVHFTQYGDETVVADSADIFAENYYFDLLAYDTSIGFGGGSERHATLTEIPQIQDFIAQALVDDRNLDAIDFFSRQRGSFSTAYKIESIDSPVRIVVTDASSRQTGVVVVDGQPTVVEDIPSSQYLEIAGTKYVITPRSSQTVTELSGEAYGGFTLTIAELGADDEQTVLTQLVNATTTPDMVARYESVGDRFSTITIDLDGDGVFEREYTLAGEVVSRVAREPVVDVAVGQSGTRILERGAVPRVAGVMAFDVGSLSTAEIAELLQHILARLQQLKQF